MTYSGLKKSKKHVFVAAKEGAGSLLSAVLLKKQGYEVTCIHFYCTEDLLEDYTFFASSFAPASDSFKKQCKTLGLKLKEIDLSKELYDQVISRCVDEFLQKQKTKERKYICSLILEQMIKIVKPLKSKFAMGYFCKNEIEGDVYNICAHSNMNLDESQLFSHIDSSLLVDLLLPLGELGKPEAHTIIKSFSLPEFSIKNEVIFDPEQMLKMYPYILSVLNSVSEESFEEEEDPSESEDSEELNDKKIKKLTRFLLTGDFVVETLEKIKALDVFIKRPDASLMEAKLFFRSYQGIILEGHFSEEEYELEQDICVYRKKHGAAQLFFAGKIMKKEVIDVESYINHFFKF